MTIHYQFFTSYNDTNDNRIAKVTVLRFNYLSQMNNALKPPKPSNLASKSNNHYKIALTSIILRFDLF